MFCLWKWGPSGEDIKYIKISAPTVTSSGSIYKGRKDVISLALSTFTRGLFIVHFTDVTSTFDMKIDIKNIMENS